MAGPDDKQKKPRGVKKTVPPGDASSHSASLSTPSKPAGSDNTATPSLAPASTAAPFTPLRSPLPPTLQVSLLKPSVLHFARNHALLASPSSASSLPPQQVSEYLEDVGNHARSKGLDGKYVDDCVKEARALLDKRGDNGTARGAVGETPSKSGADKQSKEGEKKKGTTDKSAEDTFVYKRKRNSFNDTHTQDHHEIQNAVGGPGKAMETTSNATAVDIKSTIKDRKTNKDEKEKLMAHQRPETPRPHKKTKHHDGTASVKLDRQGDELVIRLEISEKSINAPSQSSTLKRKRSPSAKANGKKTNTSASSKAAPANPVPPDIAALSALIPEPPGRLTRLERKMWKKKERRKLRKSGVAESFVEPEATLPSETKPKPLEKVPSPINHESEPPEPDPSHLVLREEELLTKLVEPIKIVEPATKSSSDEQDPDTRPSKKQKKAEKKMRAQELRDEHVGFLSQETPKPAEEYKAVALEASPLPSEPGGDELEVEVQEPEPVELEPIAREASPSPDAEEEPNSDAQEYKATALDATPPQSDPEEEETASEMEVDKDASSTKSESNADSEPESEKEVDSDPESESEEDVAKLEPARIGSKGTRPSATPSTDAMAPRGLDPLIGLHRDIKETAEKATNWIKRLAPPPLETKPPQVAKPSLPTFEESDSDDDSDSDSDSSSSSSSSSDKSKAGEKGKVSEIEEQEEKPEKVGRLVCVRIPTTSRSPAEKIQRPPPGTVSSLPFPSTNAPRFGLIQEEVAHRPFQLLVAVILLNKTKGVHAIPKFRDLVARWATPDDLAHANLDELADLLRPLGLHNGRARKLIDLAKRWIEDPPAAGRRHRTVNYPFRGAQRDIKPSEPVIGDADPRVAAFEVAHLPGVGAYALDSWRIFCRDALRGVALDWNGSGVGDAGFEPEWKRVKPADKELRAFLRWMWLREGWVWDPETGTRRLADEDKAREVVEEMRWDQKKGEEVWIRGDKDGDEGGGGEADEDEDVEMANADADSEQKSAGKTFLHGVAGLFHRAERQARRFFTDVVEETPQPESPAKRRERERERAFFSSGLDEIDEGSEEETEGGVETEVEAEGGEREVSPEL